MSQGGVQPQRVGFHGGADGRVDAVLGLQVEQEQRLTLPKILGAQAQFGLCVQSDGRGELTPARPVSQLLPPRR
jgi:hypothetical protein